MMNKREAGAIGGRNTFRKHGSAHMADIGKRGADITWQRYKLLPVGIGGYAMVDRITGEVKAVTGYTGR